MNCMDASVFKQPNKTIGSLEKPVGPIPNEKNF